MRSGGGFDAVIGNPPYIRIQTMKEWAPLEVEFYKELYRAAGKGNYDIYVVFVETGAEPAERAGRLGLHPAAQVLQRPVRRAARGLLAGGRHLAEIVHFGDQQVFAGATTYTCLLFLDKAGHEAFRFDVGQIWTRGERRAGSRRRGGAETLRVLPPHVRPATATEWNFVVRAGAELFERLRRCR